MLLFIKLQNPSREGKLFKSHLTKGSHLKVQLQAFKKKTKILVHFIIPTKEIPAFASISDTAMALSYIIEHVQL